jgi:hypothetical protein
VDGILQAKWGSKMNNNNNKLILNAFRIADDLMNLANSEYVADEHGLDILSCVMRDCAYKIRHQAEQEVHKTRREWGL